MKVYILVLGLMVLTPNLCFGYVDPGSGYLLVQLGLSFIAGALFFVPRMFARVWRFMTGKRSSSGS